MTKHGWSGRSGECVERGCSGWKQGKLMNNKVLEETRVGVVTVGWKKCGVGNPMSGRNNRGREDYNESLNNNYKMKKECNGRGWAVWSTSEVAGSLWREMNWREMKKWVHHYPRRRCRTGEKGGLRGRKNKQAPRNPKERRNIKQKVNIRRGNTSKQEELKKAGRQTDRQVKKTTMQYYTVKSVS